jgi:hypothetical protein
MNKVAIIILVFLCCSFDEPRLNSFFVSKYNGCVLKMNKSIRKKLKWEMFTNGSIKPIFSIPDSGFYSKEGIVTNDCRKVIFINDYPVGEKPNDSEKMLFFYEDGHHTSTYSWKDFQVDSLMIRRSIGHFEWLLDFELQDEERKFTLITRDWWEYEFVTLTGKFLTKKRPLGFDENTVIVGGKFYRSPATTKSRMYITKQLAGKTVQEKYIDFDANRFGIGTWNSVLMIRDGEDITPEKYRRFF